MGTLIKVFNAVFSHGRTTWKHLQGSNSMLQLSFFSTRHREGDEAKTQTSGIQSRVTITEGMQVLKLSQKFARNHASTVEQYTKLHTWKNLHLYTKYSFTVLKTVLLYCTFYMVITTAYSSGKCCKIVGDQSTLKHYSKGIHFRAKNPLQVSRDATPDSSHNPFTSVASFHFQFACQLSHTGIIG